MAPIMWHQFLKFSRAKILFINFYLHPPKWLEEIGVLLNLIRLYKEFVVKNLSVLFAPCMHPVNKKSFWF